jgi:putative endonuclease
MKSLKTTFYVYILRTSSNTLYVGQTNNLEKRMDEHRSKTIKSSKYVRSFASFELVYSEAFSTRSEAMKREYELKQLPKIKKEELVRVK